MRLLLLYLFLAPAVAPASLLPLYDSTQGSLPQAQEWLDYAATDGIEAALANPGTTVDTTGDTAANAGFSTHSVTTNGSSASWTPKNGRLPALDARTTIGLAFELQVLRQFAADALLPGLHGTASMIYLGDASADAASSYLLGDVMLAPGLFLPTPSPGTTALLLTGLCLVLFATDYRRRHLGA